MNKTIHEPKPRYKKSSLPKHVEETNFAVGRLRRFVRSRKVKRVISGSQADILLSGVDRWWRFGLLGAKFIHPGMKEVSNWGQCSKRQAQRTFAFWERLGVFEVVSDRDGGRGLAICFRVNTDRLCQVLVEMGLNPSPKLLSVIRNAEEKLGLNCQKRQHRATMDGGRNDRGANLSTPASERAQKGDKKGDTMAPRKREAKPLYNTNRFPACDRGADETEPSVPNPGDNASSKDGTSAKTRNHEPGAALSKSLTQTPLPTVIPWPRGHRIPSAPPDFEFCNGQIRVVARPEPMREPARECVPEAAEMTEADWDRYFAAHHGAEVVRELFRKHRDEEPDPNEVWR